MMDADLSNPQNWPDSLKALVNDTQEKAYWKLITSLKEKVTPLALHKRLTNEILEAIGLSAPDLENQLLPTQFENPSSYRIMTLLYRSMHRYFDEIGIEKGVHAALATIPSGSINAKVVRDMATQIPVIFYEQGLFAFIYNFTNSICVAFPHISFQKMTDPKAIVSMDKKFTIPFHLPDLFSELLVTYACNGIPVGTFRRAGGPGLNEELATMLVGLMETFVMAHEQFHLILGHKSGSDQDVDLEGQELEADYYAMATTCGIAASQCGNRAIGMWSCQILFNLYSLFFSALGILTYGKSVSMWESAIYPHPKRRAIRLVEQFPKLPNMTALEEDALLALGLMTEGITSRLWEFCNASLLLSYNAGFRSSPKWNDLVMANIKPNLNIENSLQP